MNELFRDDQKLVAATQNRTAEIKESLQVAIHLVHDERPIPAGFGGSKSHRLQEHNKEPDFEKIVRGQVECARGEVLFLGMRNGTFTVITV